MHSCRLYLIHEGDVESLKMVRGGGRRGRKKGDISALFASGQSWPRHRHRPLLFTFYPGLHSHYHFCLPSFSIYPSRVLLLPPSTHPRLLQLIFYAFSSYAERLRNHATVRKNWQLFSVTLHIFPPLFFPDLHYATFSSAAVATVSCFRRFFFLLYFL